MNLQESYENYAKADQEIAVLKAKQREIVKDINDNHLEEVHKALNHVVVLDTKAYTLIPIIDRGSKNTQEDKDKKIFELKVQSTVIFDNKE